MFWFAYDSTTGPSLTFISKSESKFGTDYYNIVWIVKAQKPEAWFVPKWSTQFASHTVTNHNQKYLNLPKVGDVRGSCKRYFRQFAI